MYDVSQYKQGQWLKLDIEGKPEPLELKLKWMPLRKATAFSAIDTETEKGISTGLVMLADLIEDWNITDNGKKVDPSPENKMEVLEFIINLMVIKEDEEKKSVGRSIIAFAGDANNFTKNSQPSSIGTKIGTNN
jgi:hypothetical protein